MGLLRFTGEQKGRAFVSVEQNRKIAEAIVTALSDREIDRVLAHMHDEGTWSVPYRTNRFPYGVKSKAEFGARAGAFLSTFSKFEMRIDSAIAEGDRVAVEASAVGVGQSGAEYANVYHISFVMKEGKAYRVREFFDPFPALDYLEQVRKPLP